jgi:hypothetical protein
MKKKLVVVLSVLLVFPLFTGCTSNNGEVDNGAIVSDQGDYVGQIVECVKSGDWDNAKINLEKAKEGGDFTDERMNEVTDACLEIADQYVLNDEELKKKSASSYREPAEMAVNFILSYDDDNPYANLCEYRILKADELTEPEDIAKEYIAYSRGSDEAWEKYKTDKDSEYSINEMRSTFVQYEFSEDEYKVLSEAFAYDIQWHRGVDIVRLAQGPSAYDSLEEYVDAYNKVVTTNDDDIMLQTCLYFSTMSWNDATMLRLDYINIDENENNIGESELVLRDTDKASDLTQGDLVSVPLNIWNETHASLWVVCENNDDTLVLASAAPMYMRDKELNGVTDEFGLTWQWWGTKKISVDEIKKSYIDTFSPCYSFNNCKYMTYEQWEEYGDLLQEIYPVMSKAGFDMWDFDEAYFGLQLNDDDDFEYYEYFYDEYAFNYSLNTTVFTSNATNELMQPVYYAADEMNVQCSDVYTETRVEEHKEYDPSNPALVLYSWDEYVTYYCADVSADSGKVVNVETGEVIDYHADDLSKYEQNGGLNYRIVITINK